MLNPGDNACVIDVETTGLDPLTCSVISIGAVKVIDGTIQDTWKSLVDPGETARDLMKKDHKEASKVHGLKPSQLKGQPTFMEAFQQLLHFRGDLDPLAHNASFDASFLRQEAIRHDLTNPIHDEELWTCSLKQARLLFPEIKRFSLDHLARKLGQPARNEDAHHDALEDALLLANCWIAWGKPESLSLFDNDDSTTEPETAAPVVEAPQQDLKAFQAWTKKHGYA